MKKLFLYTLAGALLFSACKKDDDDTITYVEPEDINVQNSYDDQSIVKFMGDHYLDAQGNIKAYSSTDSSDDNYPSLTTMNPVTLSSGVVYIVRNGAQPTPGNSIGANDVINLMVKSTSYIGYDTDGTVGFISTLNFFNTVDGSGTPLKDPMFYYVKKAVMTASGKDRSYYEIEGFKEGLQHFNAFDKTDDENYNLQGIILVPSRAAFARDEYYAYNGTSSLRNRSFVFNFQVYKSRARILPDEE